MDTTTASEKPDTAASDEQADTHLLTFTLEGLWASDWPGVIKKKIDGQKRRLAHLPALCVGLGIEYAGQLERWQSTPLLRPHLKFLRGIPYVLTDIVPHWLYTVSPDEVQPWQRKNIAALKKQIERDFQRDAVPVSAMASRAPIISAIMPAAVAKTRSK